MVCYAKAMLMLLAPSKTMDLTSANPVFVPHQSPLFLKQSKQIADVIRTMNEQEIALLMRVSPVIAANVKRMYQTWEPKSGRPALWAYKGDVYKGMKSELLTERQAQWAERHLLIMSGLYGIVRPFDFINEYRLEMKTRLRVQSANDLNAFWGNILAEYVAKRADGLVYNLCSDEYGNAVTKRLPSNVRIVTPVFYDKKPNGKVGVAPIYSKMMRGVMARWIIDHETETPEELQAFTMHGYSYDPSLSTAERPAFYREIMKPLIF